MPLIPTYDSPQVAPTGQATPSFNPNPGAQLGNVANVVGAQGRQVSEAARAMSGILLQQQDRRNAQLVMKAEAELVNQDLDYRRNAGQRLGENAHGLTKEADSWWADTSKKIGEGFENDAQRAAFDSIVTRRRSQSLDSIAGHEAQQARVATAASAEASINASVSAASAAAAAGLTPQNKAAIESEQARIKSTFGTLAAANGLPADVQKDRLLGITTKFHSEIIQGLAAKDPDGAKGWYYSHKTEIDGTRHAEIEKVLEVGGLEQKRQQVADQLQAESKTLEDGLAYIRANYSGREESEMVAEWKTRVSEQAAGLQQLEGKALAPVQTLLGDATNSGRPVSRGERDSVLAPLRASYPELYFKASQQIDAHNDEVKSQAQQAQDRAYSLQQRYSKGDDSQAAVWYSLKTDPDALRVANLMPLLQKGMLSDSQFKNLTEDQQSLRGKTGKETQDTLLSDKDAVGLVLRGAGIETTGKKADPATLGLFYQKFDARVQQEARNGKPVAQQRKTDIARELLQEQVVSEGWFRDTKKRAFEVPDSPPGFAPSTSATGGKPASGRLAPPMSTGQRAEIVKALQSLKLPATEQNIRELYQRGINQ